MPNKLIRRKRKKTKIAEQEVTVPIAPVTPVEIIKCHEPEIMMEREEIQYPLIKKPVNPLEFLLYENTEINTISVNNIKKGVLEIFLDTEMEARTIRLPKPLAHALRMAYREGLDNSPKSKRTPRIQGTKTREEDQLIQAAIDMAQLLSKLGNCHGKIEEQLIEAVKKYNTSDNY